MAYFLLPFDSSGKLTILDLYSSTVNKWLSRRGAIMVDVYICEFLQTVAETTKHKLCQKHFLKVKVENPGNNTDFCFALFAHKVALA